jgi:predicted cupin superfamily sugar epimerase
MVTSVEIVAALGLVPHPEGGFFRETFRAEAEVATPRGPRSAATAILFLVTAGRPSRFHRLLSDELWCFHAGAPLELVTLLPDGSAETVLLSGERLGAAVAEPSPQAIVEAGVWQAARVIEAGEGEDWSLVSCVVTPGFDYADFELGDPDSLAFAYPDRADEVAALT